MASLILARSYETAQKLASLVATEINAWLNEHGMALAKAKTEVVVLTAQRWFPSPFRALVVDQTHRKQRVSEIPRGDDRLETYV